MPRLSLKRRKPGALALADRARDARQWEFAAGLYREALDRHPRKPGIWVQYGHALKESGELRDPDKLAQAESAYRRAIALDPSAADPHLQLGHALKLQGKTEEAQAAYLRAFALDPSMPYPLQELGGLGWSEAQMAGLRGAVAPNSRDDEIVDPPRPASTRRRRSALYRADRTRDARQWERAAQLYRKALDRNPRRPAIWVQYGHALKESGELRDPDKLTQAEVAYRRALSLDSSTADTYVQLGHVLKLQGKIDDAKAAYLRAFALNRSIPHPLEELAGLGWSEAELLELRRQTAPGSCPAVENGPDDREGQSIAYYIDEFELTTAGLVAIGGWAAAEAGIQSIEVLLDGIGIGEAKLGLHRPDVADAHPAIPMAGQSGFAFRQELGRSFMGDHLLEVVMRGGGGYACSKQLLARAIPDRRQLNEFLKGEFGDDGARRILPYFSIIEALEDSHGPSRRDIIAPHVERMRRLSRAAVDARSIEASIIITAFDHVEYTIACVISLLEHKCNTRYEVIIGNNVSSDETRDVFEAVGGIVRCITHKNNEGFLRNCNLSAKHANGKYIILLNNDTLVLDQWLDELLAPFARFNGVGLVGSKLLMGDGSLQEAGGVIWRDGSGWNFGRGEDPTLSQYNYVKEVDYVSGASIAVLKSVWDDVGGFDERYLPAYYEDTDLAFAIRARGLRTLYSPRSQVIHHEGVTHGTDVTVGIKAYQVENQAKFVAKWQAILDAEHCVDGDQAFIARDRSGHRKHMLVIDRFAPQFDRDAGSRTMYDYLKLFVDADFQISFWPAGLHYDRQYVTALQDLGIEVLYSFEVEEVRNNHRYVLPRFSEWIIQNGKYLDYAFLSRAYVCTVYIDDIADNSAAKILYYGHDLTFPSLEQAYAVTGRAELLEAIEQHWRPAETKMWEKSDVIYYPAQYEVDWVAQHVPGKEVRALPAYIYPDKEIQAARARLDRDLTKRATVLFVGGFDHPPNADAISWFIREILPIVKRRTPDIVTIVAGSNPPREVTSLASTDVVVTGYISDPVLEWFYMTTDLAIAPLRFGGGIKGKIAQAMRFAVPVVTTTCGSEGFVGAEDFLDIADTAEDFANSIIKVLGDPRRARRRALKGLEYIEREFGYSSVSQRLAADFPELRRLHEGRGFLKSSEAWGREPRPLIEKQEAGAPTSIREEEPRDQPIGIGNETQAFISRPAERRTIDLRQWQIEITLEGADKPALRRPVGIFVHLFYDDLADEIAGHLATIDLPKRIYVSTNSEEKRETILYAFKQRGLGSVVEIAIVPNYGSDIAPLLIEYSSKFWDHDVCLKIHSKRSLHPVRRGEPWGEAWRTYLYHELMGSADRVRSIVNTMIAHPDLGVMMPHPWPGIRQWYGIGPNSGNVQRILSKIGVDLLPFQEIEYPSGSMFWFRSEALSGFDDLGFDWLDFGHAAEEQDGALQHGMERCFLFFSAKAGMKWGFLPPFQEANADTGLGIGGVVEARAFAIPQDHFLLHEGRLQQSREFIRERDDPIRGMTVALALETIDREEIEGDMAEIGVYQGEMAVLYHKILPSKSLYLFDTFTGFPTKDLEVSEDNRFSDTSIEYVKSRFGGDANVILKPGYFPETAAGMENSRFCFVMLDADLYKPTRAGLEFFYPRMSRGGYIFLHDYTSSESSYAVSRAAAEFLADKPEKVIEIPDRWGTALFRKL